MKKEIRLGVPKEERASVGRERMTTALLKEEGEKRFWEGKEGGIE